MRTSFRPGLMGGDGLSVTSFPVEEATIEGIHSAMLAGELRCRTLVETYLRRIEALDRDGPTGDVTIRPFNVSVPEEDLAELRRRIAATRWPEKEPVDDLSQGVQLAAIRALARYWETEYDFGRLEARLSGLPQFMTKIDGLDIHFIHVRSKHDDALPLIITHGWLEMGNRPPDALRARGLAHGPGGLDARSRRLEPRGHHARLRRRTARRQPHARRGPRQRHAVLADEYGYLRVPPLLGEQARLPRLQGRHRPDGRQHLPERALPGPSVLGRAGLPQPHLLQPGRRGQPLRRLAGARYLHDRGTSRIPVTALIGTPPGNGGRHE